MIPDISHGALGLSVPPFAVYKGLRITAASAYLSDLPCNLVVKVESMVARIILDEGIAKGVELGSGQKCAVSHFCFPAPQHSPLGI